MDTSTSSPAAPTALVVGATGIAGDSLCRLLVAEGWEVLGLSRRSASDVPGVTAVQADLTEAAGVRESLEPHAPTAVFLTAWARQDSEAESIRVNGAMVRDVLDAVRPAGSVRHVALLTVLKHCTTSGRSRPTATGDVPDTPFHEDEERLPYPNFYYAQEDEVVAAERDGFTWSVHRAHTIIGSVLGSAMNMGQTLAAYAAAGRAAVLGGHDARSTVRRVPSSSRWPTRHRSGSSRRSARTCASTTSTGSPPGGTPTATWAATWSASPTLPAAAPRGPPATARP